MNRPSKLDRAVDDAIAAENRRFLSSPAEVEEAQRLGDLYRERIEATLYGPSDAEAGVPSWTAAGDDEAETYLCSCGDWHRYEDEPPACVLEADAEADYYRSLKAEVEAEQRAEAYDL